MLYFQTDFEELAWFSPLMQSVTITQHGREMISKDLFASLEIVACDANRQTLPNILLDDNTIIPSQPKSYVDLTSTEYSGPLVRVRPIQKTGIHHICYAPPFILDRRMKYLRLRLLGTGGVLFTEKWARIANTCNDASVVSFFWVNQRAGWDYYTFRNYKIQQEVKDKVKFSPYATRNYQVVDVKTEIVMQVSSGIVPATEVQGVKSLLTSRCVFINDSAGAWFAYRPVQNDTIIPVYINPNSILIQEATGGGATFEFEVILKRINV